MGRTRQRPHHAVWRGAEDQTYPLNVMLRTPITLLAGLLVTALTSAAEAQILNKDAPIVVSHYHLNVTSVEEHKKFWVDTLGGTAETFGPNKIDVIKFPGVFLFLRVQRPTGPTKGTTLDHIGFAVPSVPEVAARAVAKGYKLPSAASLRRARRRVLRPRATTACSRISSDPTALRSNS